MPELIIFLRLPSVNVPKMRSFSVASLFTAVIMFMVFYEGSCTRCYVCSGISKFGGSCVDAGNTQNITQEECPGDCGKSIHTSEGVKMVSRGCKENMLCSDKNVDCYQCGGDLCNSSPGLLPSVVALAVASLVISVHYL